MNKTLSDVKVLSDNGELQGLISSIPRSVTDTINALTEKLCQSSSPQLQNHQTTILEVAEHL